LGKKGLSKKEILVTEGLIILGTIVLQNASGRAVLGKYGEEPVGRHAPEVPR
jgi:hypothetical protein